MSLFRSPIRRVLVTPIRASTTSPTNPTSFPLLPRLPCRRSYSSNIHSEPTATPATPPQNTVSAAVATSSTPSTSAPSDEQAQQVQQQERRKQQRQSSSSSLPAYPSWAFPSTPRPTQQRASSAPPPQTPVAFPPSVSIPQGYAGPSRAPTPISAPLPPYVPQPPPNLPYHVARSRHNQLPVYLVKKNNGTRQETRIRHVRGDLAVLASALSEVLRRPLGCRKTGVWINHVSGQVMVKGNHTKFVVEYLQGQGF